MTDSYIGSLLFITDSLPLGMTPLVSSGGVVSEIDRNILIY